MNTPHKVPLARSIDHIALLLLIIGWSSYCIIKSGQLEGESLLQGAGTVPLFLGCTLCFCAVVQIFFALHERVQASSTSHLKHLIITLVCTLVYLLVLEPLGYFLPTLVFMLVVGTVLGLRRFPLLLLTSMAWLGFVYGVFVTLLKIPVPIGSWFQG